MAIDLLWYFHSIERILIGNTRVCFYTNIYNEPEILFFVFICDCDQKLKVKISGTI